MKEIEFQNLPVVAHGQRGVLLRKERGVVVKVVFEKADYPSAQYGKDIEVEVVALRHAASTGLPAPRVYGSGKPEAAMTYEFNGKEWPVLGWIEMSELPGERAGDVLERDPSTSPRYATSLARALYVLHTSEPSPELAAVLKGSPLRHLEEKAGVALVRHPELASAYERVQAVVQDAWALPANALIHADIHEWNVLADASGEITGIVDWSMTASANPLHEFYDYESGPIATELLIKEYEKLSGISFDSRHLAALHALKALSLADDFPEQEKKYMSDFASFASAL